MYKGGIYSPLLTGPPEDQETFWLCSACPTRGYGLETFLCATTICSFALQEHIALKQTSGPALQLYRIYVLIFWFTFN
jgi:hypothetical protein